MSTNSLNQASTRSETNLEHLAQESPVVRPIRQVIYALHPDRLILDREQYAHIIDKQNGETELVEGPCRRRLGFDERVVGGIQTKLVLDEKQYVHVLDSQSGDARLLEGPTRRSLAFGEQLVGAVQNKVILAERQYCVISNPHNQNPVGTGPGTGAARAAKILYGEREVRQGPQSFSLHPGEKLEGPVQNEHVLTKYDAVLVKALTDTDGRHAGEKFLVKGPAQFVPSKHETILRQVQAIPLSNTDGIYVQNEDTGEVRLVTVPVDYFLAPNEKLFEKELTDDELAGLGLEEQRAPERGGRAGVRILTRQAANTSFLEDRTCALVLELEDKEVVYLYDGSDIRIEQGPKTTFLGPYERPKVLNLSGGKPIQQGVLKVALVKLGPDFIYDQIKVRTNDNAQLRVDVTYKWRFRVREDAAETRQADLKKIFSIEDFVGYAAETLSSEIRSVAAGHNFEDFHANALDHIVKKLFGEEDGERKASRIFEENGLEIFGVDITGINPEDPKIAEKLHEAIKSNMDIYCRRLVLSATLEAERQEVEGQRKIESERSELIKSQVANERLRQTETAKIQSEAGKINAESEAEAIRIKSEASLDADKKRLSAVIGELGGADNYLALQRAEAFKNAEKLVVVPTDTKLVLPFARNGFGDDE